MWLETDPYVSCLEAMPRTYILVEWLVDSTGWLRRVCSKQSGEHSPKRLRRNLANRSFLSIYCERTWVGDTDKWGISIVLSLELLGALWLTAFSLLLFSSCLLVSWDHICIHFPCNVNKSRTLICFFQCHRALPPIRRHRLQSHQEQPPNHLFPSRPRAARSLPRMHTWMGMDRGEISSVSLDLATPQRAWTVWRH